ncbi:ACT domain-containing protein ACR6 [Artemisia annua]|uniref:ACT domain-containing protein ACR n=1 Tax=Artemisia annua TaxID=35608 RepID=A0A2U1KBR3_ARTAN|nr:ACT domain-containing protein ACR6 [Artemisia annua]
MVYGIVCEVCNITDIKPDSCVSSRDRPKLLFDIICTLTDMEYVVFHGAVHTGKMEAFQEYYIRHVDGCPVSSEAERE